MRYGFTMDGNNLIKLEGTTLIDEISSKAKSEMPKCKFHENCNPKPLEVDPSVKLITFQGFSSLNEQNTLITLLRSNLNEADILFEQRYNERDKVLILEFHTEADTIAVQKLINNNLDKLKQIGIRINFEGIQFNTFVYKKNQENAIE